MPSKFKPARVVISAVAALSITAAVVATSASATAVKASSSPILVGHISSQTGVLAYPETSAAVKAGVRGVNSRGGVDGHPLKLIVCDDTANPAQDASCAREMVSKKVVAVLGDSTALGEQIAGPILAKAHIPQIGSMAYGANYTDPNVYLLQGTQATSNACQIASLSKYGKKIAEVRIDVPVTQTYLPFFNTAAAKYGAKIVNDTSIPETEADASPVAATALNSNPTGISFNASALEVQQVVTAMAQLGYNGKYASSLTTFTLANLESFKSALPNFLLCTAFPPVSSPKLKQFRSDIAAEKKSGDSAVSNTTVEVNDAPVNGWLAVQAFAKIAGGAKATTSAKITAAFKAAKNVNLGGIIPAWTPNKKGPAAYPRLSNASFYTAVIKNNKETLVNSAPTNYASLLSLSTK